MRRLERLLGGRSVVLPRLRVAFDKAVMVDGSVARLGMNSYEIPMTKKYNQI
jgi:hypothetical protein